MKFPPVYHRTTKIQKLVKEFELLKTAFALAPIPLNIISLNRQKSILRSALYSARIEGNPLTENDIILTDRQSIHKQEIMNLSKAYNYIFQNKIMKITPLFLRRLHRIALMGVWQNSGHFRTEDNAIFNQSGVAVYLPPAFYSVVPLIKNLSHYCNTSIDSSPMIAAVAHFWFEKIHPFVDGNGRVGRLLATAILHRAEFDFGGLVPFEKYLDDHREAYYDALALDRQDITAFVEFFLEALLFQIKTSLAQLKNTQLVQPEANLLPRREEIVAIIRDHRVVSFDFLKRRFPAVPASTLHFDLAQLSKQGHISKLGTTRGAVYTLVSSSLSNLG